jgi:hypothetical protein
MCRDATDSLAPLGDWESHDSCFVQVKYFIPTRRNHFEDQGVELIELDLRLVWALRDALVNPLHLRSVQKKDAASNVARHVFRNLAY